MRIISYFDKYVAKFLCLFSSYKSPGNVHCDPILVNLLPYSGTHSKFLLF